MIVQEPADEVGDLNADLAVPRLWDVQLNDLPPDQFRLPPVVRQAAVFLGGQQLLGSSRGRHRRLPLTTTISDRRPAGQAQPPLPTAPPAGTITPMTEREFATDVVRRLRAAGHTALWA